MNEFEGVHVLFSTAWNSCFLLRFALICRYPYFCLKSVFIRVHLRPNVNYVL